VNIAQIDSLMVAGRGGKEQGIAGVLLPSAQRASSPLHDYEIWDGETRYRIEVKNRRMTSGLILESITIYLIVIEILSSFS